jgi:hypothetical protein
MIQLTPVHLPDCCANLACPNKPHEGQFTLLETEGDAVGGHRPIQLWMCHPCAAALVNGPTKPAADNWPSTPAPPEPVLATEYVRETNETWRNHKRFPTKYSGTVYAPPTSERHVHDTDPGGNCRHPDCGYYHDMAVVLDDDNDPDRRGSLGV